MNNRAQTFSAKIATAQHILVKCVEAEQEHVINFIAELKKDCKTYFDVQQHFDEIKRHFRLYHGLRHELFFEQVDQVLENEKNGLPLVK